MKNFKNPHQIPLYFLIFLLTACAGSKYIPTDLAQTNTPEALGEAAKNAYLTASKSTEKADKLKFAHAGISYADKCLKLNADQPVCLYYHALNTGVYIRNHIPNYQVGLKKMVANCDKLITVQPDFEQGGCYRVLGNIYAQAPSFSLNPKNITQDLDKSVENLKEAVKIAPNYALNHLFLAKSLEAIGEKDQAQAELKEFNRLKGAELDSDYPEWQKDQDELAKKLQSS